MRFLPPLQLIVIVKTAVLPICKSNERTAQPLSRLGVKSSHRGLGCFPLLFSENSKVILIISGSGAKHSNTRPFLKTSTMKRVLTRKADKPQVTHHCGECRKAVFDYKFENLSLDGKPTLVSCPKSGRFKRVVSEKACSEFEMRIE